MVDIKIEVKHLYSGYIYNDIDNRKQNLILKLLSAIDNIKLATMAASDIAIPIITYYSKDFFISLND